MAPLIMCNWCVLRLAHREDTVVDEDEIVAGYLWRTVSFRSFCKFSQICSFTQGILTHKLPALDVLCTDVMYGLAWTVSTWARRYEIFTFM
jgi:hypothetical protein